VTRARDLATVRSLLHSPTSLCLLRPLSILSHSEYARLLYWTVVYRQQPYAVLYRTLLSAGATSSPQA
jgi:hypothetical protein